MQLIISTDEISNKNFYLSPQKVAYYRQLPFTFNATIFSTIVSLQKKYPKKLETIRENNNH